MKIIHIFSSIPYAEPPVGNLRFRNPVPHRGWSGVRDGSEHGNYCPSDGKFLTKLMKKCKKYQN